MVLTPVAERRVRRRPTVGEMRLLERGLPTDTQAQDRIAEDMARWLVPALAMLGQEFWRSLRADIARGVVAFAPIAVKATPETATDPWWEKATEGWESAAGEWLQDSMARTADYQARRFNFYVDMRMVNQAVSIYTEQSWWPDLIKLDGPESIIATTRERVWATVRRWQLGELGERGLPDLIEHLAKWFEPARAERIAVTEATRVYAEGSRWAWLGAAKDPELEQALGITARRWQTARDEFVCPICTPLNNRQMLLDRDFPVPGGDPPAHPACRCWPTPIKSYNPRQHPKGAGRRPSKAAIDKMRKATLPERWDEIFEQAAAGVR